MKNSYFLCNNLIFTKYLQEINKTNSAEGGKNVPSKNYDYSGRSSLKSQHVSPEINLLGMTVDEALEITRNDVADALDGLPPIKMHCSNLAADALTEAIKDYKSKKSE